MVILQAEKWVHGGYTIAHSDGKTFFIKGSIPNERVECEIIKQSSKAVHVRVKKVLSESKERIPIDCEAFPLCGGCSFRHISYEKELEIKKNLLEEEFKRKNIVFAKNIFVSYENHIGYRNNFQIKMKDKKFGFFQDFSNEIVPIPGDGCKNLSLNLNHLLHPEKLKISLKWRELSKVYPCDKEEGIYFFQDMKIFVPKNGFFQVNSFLLPKWLKEIQTLVPKEAKVLELFSGCGLISLSISEICESLFGLELDSNSIRYAKKNSIVNNKTNLEFQLKDLYKSELPNSNFDILVCNPPRKGLGKKVLKWIQKNLPNQILYSSCNYLTLSYDLHEIYKQGYALEYVHIFDFFPRTPYFETLVLLKKSC